MKLDSDWEKCKSSHECYFDRWLMDNNKLVMDSTGIDVNENLAGKKLVPFIKVLRKCCFDMLELKRVIE